MAKSHFQIGRQTQQPRREKTHFEIGNIQQRVQSLVLSGWGSSQVRGTKNKWWIGASAYALLGSGIYLKINADKRYKDYQAVQSPELAQSTLDKAHSQQTLAQILIVGGGAIWVGDMVYTLIKGNKNDKMQKEILNRKRDLSFRWYGTGA